MIFTRKMPEFYEFYVIIARKIFFPNFRGGGTCPPTCPPVFYAYDEFDSNRNAPTVLKRLTGMTPSTV